MIFQILTFDSISIKLPFIVLENRFQIIEHCRSDHQMMPKCITTAAQHSPGGWIKCREQISHNLVCDS